MLNKGIQFCLIEIMTALNKEVWINAMKFLQEELKNRVIKEKQQVRR